VFQKVGDKTCLYIKVVQQIERSILQGHFKRGDKIPTEKELMQMFSVSRTSIREAVKILAVSGYVEVRHGYGSFVGDFDSNRGTLTNKSEKENILKILEIRKVLEPKIAFYAAKSASRLYIQKLYGSIDLTEKKLREDKAAFVQYKHSEFIKKFHLALADASGNRMLVSIIKQLLDLLSGYRVKSWPVPGRITRSFGEHKEIAGAVLSGYPERASRAMYNHISSIEEDVRVFYRDNIKKI